jgi:hypothetical protein
LKQAEKIAAKKTDEETVSSEKSEKLAKTLSEGDESKTEKTPEKAVENKEEKKPESHMSKKASAYSQFLNELSGDDQATPKKEASTEKADAPLFEAKTVSTEPAKEHLDSIE